MFRDVLPESQKIARIRWRYVAPLARSPYLEKNMQILF